MSAIEKDGKTVEEALQAALTELNLSAEQVDYKVLEEGKKGIFGFFGSKARVLVTPKAAPAEATAPKTALEEVMEAKATPAPIAEAIATAAAAATAPTPVAPTTEAIVTKPASFSGPKRENREFVVDDAAVEEAKEFLNKIFVAMKIKVVMEKFINKNTGSVVLKLHGDDMGILIGKHGQTLDALQYLTNLVANKNASERMHVIIDVENYRDRRVETLTKLAKRLADKVKKTGERVVLEPMNPHERKIIHTALQNDRKITTLSEGNDPYRKVVIELKK